MKKSFLPLVLSLLLLAGCAPVAPTLPAESPAAELELPVEPPAETPAPETPTPEAADPLPEHKPLVHELGTSDALVETTEYFSGMLSFPITGMKSADKQIRAWAEGLLQSTLEEVTSLRETDDTAEGELNFHYNAYLLESLESGFAGIEELGFYSTSALAHPYDTAESFNIDLSTGAILDNASLIAESGREAVLSLAREKLLAQFPELEEGMLGESILDIPVLRHEGVAFLLPRGVLPSALGFQEVLLSYEELGEALVLPEPAPASLEEAYLPMSDETVFVPEYTGTTTVDSSKPMVALTFDDGPSKTTPKILQLLQDNGGHATFFMIGNRVESYPDAVNAVLAQGSEIGCHTWSHKNLRKLGASEVRSEINKAGDAVERVTGRRPTLLRPPYGASSDTVAAVCRELGLPIINWNVDTEDWKTKNAAKTYDHIMAHVEDGAIILCHDLHAETGDAMERVIPELVRQGYQLVTVSELLSARGGSLEAGKLYRHK